MTITVKAKGTVDLAVQISEVINMFEKEVLQAKNVLNEFIETAKLTEGNILVIGCSSSEIVGENIGKGSSLDAAKAVFDAIYPILKSKGIYLAVQCCEHLNRALIIEAELAKLKNLETVNVLPQPKAGGSFATCAYNSFDTPVAVESIKADAGIDIGDTLIGMHLKTVAVPIRLQEKQIGFANVVCARTRPKFIGGCRAKYNEDIM